MGSTKCWKDLEKVIKTLLVLLSFWSVCHGWWVSHGNSKNNSDNNLILKCNKFFRSVHLQDIASYVNAIADPNMLHGDGSA